MSVMGVLESPVMKQRPGFATELERVVSPVQSALRQLLAEWGAPQSASDLVRISGADRTLSWRVMKVAQAENAAAEARNVPSPAYLKKFLASARAAGVSGQTIKAVESAAKAFQSFTKETAADRGTFDSLSTGVSAAGAGSVGIRVTERRAVYRAQSQIQGVQTDLHLSSVLLGRRHGEDSEGLTLVSQRGVRRLRPEAQIVLWGYHKDPAGIRNTRREGVLDVEAEEAHGMPVIGEFSTKPFPKVERMELTSGYEIFSLVGNEVGPQSEVDFTVGTYSREGRFMRDAGGRALSQMMHSFIRKPVAMFVQEVLIHRETYPNARPAWMVNQYMEGVSGHEGQRKLQRYPMEEKLVHLGRADRVGLEAVPRYGEMLRYGAGTMGWELSEFDVWRVVVEYPIMWSTSRIWFYVD